MMPTYKLKVKNKPKKGPAFVVDAYIEAESFDEAKEKILSLHTGNQFQSEILEYEKVDETN